MFIRFFCLSIASIFFVSDISAASSAPIRYEDLTCLHEKITEDVAKKFYNKHFGQIEERSPEAHNRMLKETGKGIFEGRFAIDVVRERIIALIYAEMSPLTDLSMLFDEQMYDYYGSFLARIVRRGDYAGADYMLSKVNIADVQKIKASLVGECRKQSMAELLMDRGISFDLFDIFPLWKDKPRGQAEVLLLQRGADIKKRSQRGLNPLIARISYTYSTYCCAGWMGQEALNESFGDDGTGGFYVLIHAGAERHDRISEESAKAHRGEDVINKTAAEFLRYTLLVKDSVPGYAELADYMDSYGSTLQERAIRAIILRARSGDAEACAQIDNIPQVLKTEKGLALFNQCKEELLP